MKIDKVYLINLKKREDRLIKIDKLFKDLGGIFKDYERIEAIDGNTISVKENNDLSFKTKIIFDDPSRIIDIQVKGTIGCYLSHLKIWEDAQKNNYDNIIIFEDDVSTELTLSEIMEYINNIPNDYDLAYMDYFCLNSLTNIEINNYWDKNSVDRIVLASAYILSKKGLQKILSRARPIEVAVDYFLSFYTQFNKDFNRYIPKKKIFSQNILDIMGFDTNINPNFSCIKCIINDYFFTNTCCIIIILIIIFILLKKK
jgi:GR25 family glycosyltransferase involved in LPS biosynthesis